MSIFLSKRWSGVPAQPSVCCTESSPSWFLLHSPHKHKHLSEHRAVLWPDPPVSHQQNLHMLELLQPLVLVLGLMKSSRSAAHEATWWINLHKIWMKKKQWDKKPHCLQAQSLQGETVEGRTPVQMLMKELIWYNMIYYLSVHVEQQSESSRKCGGSFHSSSVWVVVSCIDAAIKRLVGVECSLSRVERLHTFFYWYHYLRNHYMTSINTEQHAGSCHG